MYGIGRRRMLGGAAAAGIGMVVAAVRPAPASAATVPADPYPPVAAPLVEAEQIVDYLRLPQCPPGNNVYKEPGQPNVVTWGQPGDPATWFVQAQCSSFLTAVLRRTFPGWATDEYFLTYFGSRSPYARDYQNVWAMQSAPHVAVVPRVTDLLPGDLIAIDYNNGQPTNTGHVVMVRRVKPPYTSPYPTQNFPGESQYPIEVVDCTSDPHGVYGIGDYFGYPDTRIVDGGTENTGVGYGHMMYYCSDASGAFTRYRWSVNTSSSGIHTIAERPIAAVRPG